MKSKLLFVLSILSFALIAQSTYQIKYIEYGIGGKGIDFTENSIIKTDSFSLKIEDLSEMTDLNLPDYKLLFNPESANLTLKIWNHNDSINRSGYRWNYTYKYDSIGRLIEYSFSNCAGCSSFPFQYQLQYKEGKIIRVTDLLMSKESWSFQYRRGELHLVLTSKAGIRISKLKIKKVPNKK